MDLRTLSEDKPGMYDLLETILSDMVEDYEKLRVVKYSNGWVMVIDKDTDVTWGNTALRASKDDRRPNTTVWIDHPERSGAFTFDFSDPGGLDKFKETAQKALDAYAAGELWP